ncbi:MAG: methyl-accepting chemotaxis protein [Lachnospiraceae bacterium]|nr:methyl-accepting chemotaxis protein [Lachnospiraceae bacterium]
MKKNNSIHSVKVKICILVDIAVILTGLIMILTYSPNVKKEMGTICEHYLGDLAEAYGTTLDNEIKRADGNAASVLKTDNLSLKLDGEGLEGMESSYVYVVAKNGSMVYHPNGSKIGKSVENAVVKQACEDLQAGKEVENGVISYLFDGETKYASIYVSTYSEFILIVTADQNEIFAPISRVNMLGIVGIVVSCAIFMIAGFILAAMIVKPIQRMTDLTIKISDMDFREDEIQAKLSRRKDEIGSMSRALSLLRGELVEVVQGIKNQSEMLMDAADNLSSSASETSTTMDQVENAVNEIAQGATSQAEETQSATENVVAMGNMVEETNQIVERLVDYASKMKASSNHAKEILNELDQVNKKTEKYIDVIAKQTDTTNESAQKISEAASMITEIAEETNLLSLNASIEAARAGEQGRGFAVVASQIQKLAEQSNESAQQIGDIINVLLQDSEKAVEIMADVKVSMKEQSEHVEKTDQAFGEIQTEVDGSIDAMHYISEKTNQMDEARSKVIDVVQSLTAIAEENAASTEETSAAVTEVSAIVTGISEKSEELRKIAEDMENKMNIFQI